MRLLVAEGNIAADRRRIADLAGATPGESYANVLRAIAPDASVDICAPADEDARIPLSLDAYDGVAITGSALNIYKRETGSLRQIEFMRELFDRGIPTFGSCWGLQVAAVAAGGEVGPNPRGREVAFARKIMLNEAGRVHPMHAGRAPAFDAPAIHADELVRLPEQTIVTAWNRMSEVQAAEIHYGNGVFWGVQYHPEYGLGDIAATVRRYGTRLVDEGFFPNVVEIERYAADLLSLEANAARGDIAWRLGLEDDVLKPEKRLCEISNWVRLQVRQKASARDRG